MFYFQPKLQRLPLPLLLLLLAGGDAHSQPANLSLELSDHSLLSGFSESEITTRELQRDINYRIVLGGLQRTRGEVVPENSERLRGDVTKITYEVSQEFTGEDVYQYFLEQLENKNYSVLFSCEGRACGSSNYWANDIFANRILYGLEHNQFYLAFKANSGAESEPYFALYIVTRANRKIYAHLEIIEPGGSQGSEKKGSEQKDPEQGTAPVTSTPQPAQGTAQAGQEIDLLQRLQRQGSAVLRGINFNSDSELTANTDLSVLLSLLNSNQSLSVYLVSHLKESSQSLSVLMQRSNTRANTLRQALIAAGIDASRITAAGVGPLAPNCDSNNCDQRIELVLR